MDNPLYHTGNGGSVDVYVEDIHKNGNLQEFIFRKTNILYPFRHNYLAVGRGQDVVISLRHDPFRVPEKHQDKCSHDKQKQGNSRVTEDGSDNCDENGKTDE